MRLELPAHSATHQQLWWPGAGPPGSPVSQPQLHAVSRGVPMVLCLEMQARQRLGKRPLLRVHLGRGCCGDRARWMGRVGNPRQVGLGGHQGVGPRDRPEGDPSGCIRYTGQQSLKCLPTPGVGPQATGGRQRGGCLPGAGIGSLGCHCPIAYCPATRGGCRGKEGRGSISTMVPMMKAAPG